MSLTLSDVVRTTFVGGLGTLNSVLEAAAKHGGGDPEAANALLEARLIDDMFTLAQQVQAATDTARRVTDRLAGRDASRREDPERSIDALRERIAQTIEHVRAGDAAAIDARTDQAMTIDLGGGPMEFTGRSYALGFAIPNFLFHVATAYDILRHRGVQLGKVDYVRPFVGATFG